MKRFPECEYSAFISYAHADDEAWFSWVTQFHEELSIALRALMRGVRVPPLHLSGENGPVAGALSDELKKRIGASFALIIVVHDNYAQSEWCLKELEYFKSLFGDDGFRQRLYIVALSQKSMTLVEQKPDWKRLCPFPDQLWIPFYQKLDDDKPVDIHVGKVISQDFKEPFLKLREDLVRKIKEDLVKPAEPEKPAMPAKPESEAVQETTLYGMGPPAADEPPAPKGDEPVRIYIESNQNERGLWEPLGKQIEKKWDAIVGHLKIVPPLHVRAWGLPVDHIDKWPKLDDADGVVLLWGRKTGDALVAQIDKVERKLSGRNVAPGIVAYLIPPHRNPDAPMPAWGWKVLRFDTKGEEHIDVMQEEADDLQKFLEKVLERSRNRQAGVGSPQLAAQTAQ
jgi:TIR domain-containing protein